MRRFTLALSVTSTLACAFGPGGKPVEGDSGTTTADTHSGVADEDDLDDDGYDDFADCNDTDPTVNPGAVEVCNGQDDDCDGVVDPDDAVGAVEAAADGDGDGFGDPARSYVGCSPPVGYATQGGDCDDRDADVNPGAQEVCDATLRDEDCDGLVDTDDPSMTGGCGYTRLTGSWTMLVVCTNTVSGLPESGRTCSSCNFSFETVGESNVCGITIDGVFGFRASDSTVHGYLNGLGETGALPAVLTRGTSYDTLTFEGGSGNSAISGEFHLY